MSFYATKPWLAQYRVPAELPLGVLTAALGAPFFIWLLAKRGKDA